jgi:hypothetical protein
MPGLFPNFGSEIALEDALPVPALTNIDNEDVNGLVGDIQADHPSAVILIVFLPIVPKLRANVSPH